MYNVQIYDSPDDFQGTLVHSPRGMKTKFDIHLVLKGISSMSITFAPNNPAINNIKPLNSLIEVTHAKTGKTLFKGRFLKPEHRMNNDGLLTLKYTCESRLAYLHDSNQRWEKVQNTTIRDFLDMLLHKHNQQVEPHKRFKLGEVTVTNPTDNVYRYVGYESTFDEIQDNLIDRLGGYLRIRDEPDGMYLDYLKDVGEKSSPSITLRGNLKDFRREIDPTNIVTRVIPLGERLEISEEEDYNASEPRLTMESINNGVDYLENQELIDEFGVIEGTIIYDDITMPEMLRLRAEQFFQAQDAAIASYDVSAINLDLIDATIPEFELGNWYDISTEPLTEIKDTLQIVEMKLNSDSPQLDQLTLGAKPITLSSYQNAMRKQTKTINNLQGQFARNNRRVVQLSSAYSSISQDIQNVQQTLQNSNVENLPQHLQAIEDQLSAIQRELEQIEPPPSGGGDGDGGGSGIKYFPVDYTRSGINFWTGMQHDMGFGRRSSGDWHAGYDIGGGGTGHPVYAIASGTVTAASYVGGWGNRITIEHSTDNYHTLYAHLASMDVVVGQTLEAGQRIGMMGASGGNYAIHLHVELSETGLFDDGNTIDPAPYLGVIADNTTSLPNPG